jgi:hypothetical protein
MISDRIPAMLFQFLKKRVSEKAAPINGLPAAGRVRTSCKP